ncbi:hypothetical protein HM1_2864 [Heliomicrobium modesticaldum Ice1]|uniref:Uncharacterized protein n=1 Tax=Heliobacterium modesticaldum (strain ATCC 51547 / Ice1) TaxID=498761 RepID=B0TCI5_HELMI|nr:hypothetical protein HM1_2864 [Heliomicrobium modesticaldum Ice1]
MRQRIPALRGKWQGTVEMQQAYCQRAAVLRQSSDIGTES